MGSRRRESRTPDLVGPGFEPRRLHMIECDNCGHVYDGTAHRWLCPRCKWKSSCCEGAPCPVV